MVFTVVGDSRPVNTQGMASQVLCGQNMYQDDPQIYVTVSAK